MILCIMCYDIYMLNLTLKSTQKLLLNFISTIVNNEAASYSNFHTGLTTLGNYVNKAKLLIVFLIFLRNIHFIKQSATIIFCRNKT